MRIGLIYGLVIGCLLWAYLLVRAVAPGMVANPTFSPTVDDVTSGFRIPCNWNGVYGYGGLGGTTGYRYIGIGSYGHHSEFSVGGRCVNGFLTEVKWMHTYYGS